VQIGYQTQLVAPPTFKNVVTGEDLGQRNSTLVPYLHMGTNRRCTPSATTQCCIYTDSRFSYDYW
jgi:hypothetical protein